MTVVVAATKALNCANLWDEMQNGSLKTLIAPKITSGDDQGIANLLNSQSGTATGPVNHADMQSQDVSAVVNYTEYRGSVTANDMTTWQTILQGGNVKIGSANIQGFINAAFASCPVSLAALQALFTQTGARSEVLFGTGVFVTAQQVNIARTTSGTGTF